MTTVRTILVVDDDPQALTLTGRSLRCAGYRVMSAASGEAGVEKARRLIPDLVLMDDLLPGSDGYEAIRRLHRAPETSWIPVIVVSVVVRDSLPPARMLHAAAEHLTKSVPLGLLLDRVAKHVNRSHPWENPHGAF